VLGEAVIEPDSVTVVVVLLLGAGLLLLLLVRAHHAAARVGAGALALALSATAGIAVVNDYYGYYRSWSQLSADLAGGYGHYGAAQPQPVAVGNASATVGNGRLERVRFDGARSGIVRDGLVYLPPQYFERRFAHTRFPVVELFHGSPGSPRNWVVQLRLVRVVDHLLAQHLMGPLVLVMPAIDAGHHYEDCVDAPKQLDDTYLTHDVRVDVEARFRVSAVAAEWGSAGYTTRG
jgi:hypothetical protein